MPHPQSIAETITAPSALAGSADTSTAFIAALFEKGPLTAQLITSLDRARTVYGADVAYSQAASYLEAYLRIGGNRAWVSRIVGPTPVAASITFNGSGATPSVKFTVNDVGAWGNGLRAAMLAPLVSGIRFQLTDAAGNVLVQSGDLADKAAVLAYTGASGYGVFGSAGAGTIPIAVALANLTGGTDDNTNVTDTQRAAALAKFPASMGPGQVLLPGDTRQLAGSLLGAHGAATNRRALYDEPDDPSAAAVAAACIALRSDANASKIIPVGPWAQGPPIVNGGTVRDIPYSVVQAAVLARQDRLTGNPNEPAAGDNGLASWITGLKRTYTDAELDTLNDAGANVAIDLYGNGQFRMYGNRTVVDPITNKLYLLASNVRLDMAILAQGKLIANKYVEKQIDGKGKLAGKYAGEVTTMLGNLPEGALYALLDANGNEVDPGYVVDGSSGPENSSAVNKPSTIAAGQLIVVVGVRRSPGAELVYFRIVNHLTNEGLS